MNTAQNKLLKIILPASCFASFLVGNAHATVTNVAYWRGGENDFPEATQGSRITVDIAGTNNLQPWNTPQSTPGYNQFGPYYATPANYTVDVNATRAPGSSVNWDFDPGAGNTFTGSAITTANANWGIQCYTTTQYGYIMMNGNAGGAGSGGYGLFVHNGFYSAIMPGIAVLQGTVAPNGNWRNLALVNNNGTLELYVDGVLDVYSYPGGSQLFGAGNKLTFGGTYNGSDYVGIANGSIDEARLFTFEVGAFEPEDLLDYVPGAYASWATANAGGQTANLDYDNDGVPNGVEYFMNAASGFTANPGLVGNTVTWPNGGKIPRTGYGTKFMVQTSSDLVTWEDVTDGDMDQNGTNTASSLSYTLDPANNPGKQFVRLKVTP
jgi:hypothetical protein